MENVCVCWYQDWAPTKRYIRGLCFLTGYYILSTADSKYEPGCRVTYISHSDLRGMYFSRTISLY